MWKSDPVSFPLGTNSKYTVEDYFNGIKTYIVLNFLVRAM